MAQRHAGSTTKVQLFTNLGDLSHDTKAGFGKLMLSNDEYFEGEFRGDQVHGWGTYHCKDGSVIKGYWEEGLMTRLG